ncbi:MAG: peroxiredoxin family protein [Gammaproteobacteria bacterium]
MKAILRWLAVGGLCGLWLMACDSVSGRAPDVVFKDIRGQSVALADMRGKPVLVTFWATSCSICIAEIPDLVHLYEEFAPEGFRLFTVAMNYDPPNRVVEFARERQFPFPAVLDLNAELARAFGPVQQIPANFLIAPDGSVALHRLGRIDLEKIRPLIREMLDEEPG